MDDVSPLYLDEEEFKVAPVKAKKKALEKARVRLNQMVALEKLVFLGKVQLSEWGHKRHHVFSTPSYQTKSDWVQHDLMLWKYLRTIKNAKAVTGFEADQTIRADAEVLFSDKGEAFIEMDMESESLSKVIERLDILNKGQRKVLFISITPGRIKKLQAKAAQHEIADRIFFALWFDLKEGKEHRWEDCGGETGVLYPVNG